MDILNTMRALMAIFSGDSPDYFYDHWNKYSLLESNNELRVLSNYDAAPVFFQNHTYSLSVFVVTLHSLSMKNDVNYGDPMLSEGDGCWFPENDDYNEIPLSQIMFKFGDHLDYVSDDEMKTIILVVANACLNIFNKHRYPPDILERSRLAEIIKRVQEN
jgi:hypothetical protein